MCGAVAFEVDPPLGPAVYCHCRRCQRRSGAAASANVRVDPGSFRVVSGEEHVRCWTPDAGMGKCFCGECGSALYSRRPDTGEVFGVRMGAFDGDPGVAFSHRQWVSSAADWEPIPDDGLPRHPEYAPRPR